MLVKLTPERHKLSSFSRDFFRCSATWPRSPTSNQRCKCDSGECLGPLEAGREHRGPKDCSIENYIERGNIHTTCTIFPVDQYVDMLMINSKESLCCID
jgi:hypothetical protein